RAIRAGSRATLLRLIRTGRRVTGPAAAAIGRREPARRPFRRRTVPDRLGAGHAAGPGGPTPGRAAGGRTPGPVGRRATEPATAGRHVHAVERAERSDLPQAP